MVPGKPTGWQWDLGRGLMPRSSQAPVVPATRKAGLHALLCRLLPQMPSSTQVSSQREGKGLLWTPNGRPSGWDSTETDPNAGAAIVYFLRLTGRSQEPGCWPAGSMGIPLITRR